MPYKRLSELPPAVQKLGKLEQNAWLKAFNSAWDGYRKENDRKYDSKQPEAMNRERYSFSVAWNAVKRMTGKE